MNMFQRCIIALAACCALYVGACGEKEESSSSGLEVDLGIDSNSETEQQLTCEELSCSSNGNCIDDAENGAHCECNTGFIGDGFECDPASHWERHLIADQHGTNYIYSVDMDGDGDLDLLVSGHDANDVGNSEIAWYRNDGDGASWTKFVISEDSESGIRGANGIVAGDFVGDDALEVVVATGPFRPFREMKRGVYLFTAPSGPEGTWTRTDLVTDDVESYWKVYGLDADKDGALDIVVAGESATFLLRNPGDCDEPWEVMSMGDGTGSCIVLADMNGDEEIDVLHSNYYSSRVSWSECRMESGELVFEEHLISDSTKKTFDVAVTDINGDGAMDVITSTLMAPGVRWFAAPTAEGDPWLVHEIRDDFPMADIYVGDIDGDGKDDIIGASYGDKADILYNIAWFRKEPEGADRPWTTHYIEWDDNDIPSDVELVDIDNDGDLDVLGGSMGHSKVYWYENLIN